MVSRRHVLTAGVGLVPVLAGCSQLSAAVDSPPELRGILLGNGDTTAHTVHLLVAEGDSVVHWRSYRLDAIDDSGPNPDVDTITVDPSTLSLESPGCTVRARLDDRSDWQSIAVTEDAATDCVSVTVSVEPGDPGEAASLDLHLSGTTDDCRPLTSLPAE